MSTAKTTGTEAYQKPEVEIIEMELEGCILAGSGSTGSTGNGGKYDEWR